MNQGRTKKSIINISTSFLGQIIAILLGFINRLFFVNQLGEVYLGINGLCTSIIGLMALAELGVGESINYKLYEPLATNNKEQIKSLMNLYKKVYRYIGVIVFIIGICILPFFNYFLKQRDLQSVDNLYLIFFLFVLNASATYFYTYKRALIISDQKRYIVSIIHYSLFILMNIAQIIVLIKSQNFILYLMIMIVNTILENLVLSKITDKLYPFLKEKSVQELKHEDVKEIKKNTIALLYHKVGSTIVNSTDNILISKLIGIATVGLYSNYLLITSALNTIIAQLFSALTASVGNLGALTDRSSSEIIFKRLFFANFWFISIICSSLYSVVNILVSSWIGPSMLLDEKVIVFIVINVYLYNIRRSVWTFRDAFGLFWYDRYKALAEAILNLVISIILGIRIGLSGILLGTIISMCITSLWIEPYVLYRFAFIKKTYRYYGRLLLYSLITVLLCILNDYIIDSLNLVGFQGFAIGVIICIFINTAVISLLFCKSDEFKYYINLLKKII